MDPMNTDPQTVNDIISIIDQPLIGLGCDDEKKGWEFTIMPKRNISSPFSSHPQATLSSALKQRHHWICRGHQQERCVVQESNPMNTNPKSSSGPVWTNSPWGIGLVNAPNTLRRPDAWYTIVLTTQTESAQIHSDTGWTLGTCKCTNPFITHYIRIHLKHSAHMVWQTQQCIIVSTPLPHNTLGIH